MITRERLVTETLQWLCDSRKVNQIQHLDVIVFKKCWLYLVRKEAHSRPLRSVNSIHL